MEQMNYEFEEEAFFDEAIQDVMAQFYYMRPGIIEGFNPETNRANAIIAIKAKRIVGDEVTYVTAPVIEDVPMCIPYSFGAGTCLTVPILKGDPCTLFFSDRMMDVFLRTGQLSPPEDNAGPDNITATPRMHSMADAILVPGLLTSRVGTVSNILADWNQEAIELRDRERTRFISLGALGIEVNNGDCFATFRKGKIHMVAPNGFTVDSPNWQVGDDGGNWSAGTIRANELETEAGFTANGHRHGGVEPGGGTSGTFV